MHEFETCLVYFVNFIVMCAQKWGVFEEAHQITPRDESRVESRDSRELSQAWDFVKQHRLWICCKRKLHEIREVGERFAINYCRNKLESLVSESKLREMSMQNIKPRVDLDPAEDATKIKVKRPRKGTSPGNLNRKEREQRKVWAFSWSSLTFNWAADQVSLRQRRDDLDSRRRNFKTGDRSQIDLLSIWAKDLVATRETYILIWTDIQRAL